ncbi:hormone receptor domain protein [Orientia tsutsugamushi str. Sido]|nr:hormone receptor domain protein [Orientia tsutsugamushi str. Sido]
MQTIGNCSSETVKSKECVSYSPRKYIYRFNTVQEVLKCKVDHSRCTVNVRSCTNDELMDRANTQLTNYAVKSETALIGLFKTTNNLICSGIIDKVCKDVKYKCQPKFTISDNGTVIDIETCTDNSTDSKNKEKANVTDFVCSTTKLESCDKLSESKFYTLTNSRENLIRHYNSANLLGELIEMKKYVNKLDTKAVLIDPKFCGNRIKQCLENKHCTIFDESKKFILGDEQEYVIKRCQTQLCYAKTSEEKKVDKDDVLVKSPYEGDGKTRFRSKNALELGLCQVIPDIPKCKQEESYNAIWPETSPGEEAIGQCKKGPNPRIKYIPIDNNSLKRRCLFDPAIDANSNVHFTSGDTAKPVFALQKNKKVGCQEYKVKCSKISENGVIWPAVEVDATSQPKCVNSAHKLSNSSATRKCELDHKNNPVFTSPTATVSCSHPNKCNRLVDTKNGVVWPAAEVRELSRPTCVNKNHKLSHSNARRECVLDNKGDIPRLKLHAIIDAEDSRTRGHRIRYILASKITCYDPNKCSEVLENGIIWSEAEVGKESRPRCERPDYKVSHSVVTRMCLNDNGGVPKLASTVSYSLSPIGQVSASVSSIQCLPR